MLVSYGIDEYFKDFFKDDFLPVSINNLVDSPDNMLIIYIHLLKSHLCIVCMCTNVKCINYNVILNVLHIENKYVLYLVKRDIGYKIRLKAIRSGFNFCHEHFFHLIEKLTTRNICLPITLIMLIL